MSSKSTILRRPIVVVAIVVLLCGITFTQLPLRTQGRVVEIATFGDWPLEWALRHQFSRINTELAALRDFVEEAPMQSGLTITATGVRGSDGVETSEIDPTTVLQALLSIEADAVLVLDDRIGVVLGVEDRGATSFEVSYIYPLTQQRRAVCKNLSSRERPKVGECVVQRLSSSLGAGPYYVGHPATISLFVKQLFFDAVTRTASGNPATGKGETTSWGRAEIDTPGGRVVMTAYRMEFILDSIAATLEQLRMN